MAAVVFYALSILLLPVTAVGYVVWIVTGLLRRTPGVSFTAQGPLNARCTEHLLGTRQDEPACRLMRELPGVSPVAVRLTVGPLVAAHRASGYVPKAFRYPFTGDVPVLYEASARTTFFDGVIDECLAASIRQFVILGAGFDTRAYRLPRDSGVRTFDVDAPAVEATLRKIASTATGSVVAFDYFADECLNSGARGADSQPPL